MSSATQFAFYSSKCGLKIQLNSRLILGWCILLRFYYNKNDSTTFVRKLSCLYCTQTTLHVSVIQPSSDSRLLLSWLSGWQSSHTNFLPFPTELAGESTHWPCPLTCPAYNISAWTTLKTLLLAVLLLCGCCSDYLATAAVYRTITYLLTYSVVIVRKQPPLVGEVSANFCRWRMPRGQRDRSLRPYTQISRPNRTIT
jgi:hypothetical protein